MLDHRPGIAGIGAAQDQAVVAHREQRPVAQVDDTGEGDRQLVVVAAALPGLAVIAAPDDEPALADGDHAAVEAHQVVDLHPRQVDLRRLAGALAAGREGECDQGRHEEAKGVTNQFAHNAIHLGRTPCTRDALPFLL
ncbi:hypothetical protein D3C78_1576110 [compost metagenome]